MDIEPSSRLSCLRHHITSDWRVFECVDAKINKRHVNRKTSDWSKVIVRYMEDTDIDILGLGLGFLTTSSLMWISNRGHVICDGGII